MRTEDEIFVNRCLEGDQAAFDFLVNKYKEVVHAYAYHKVGDYQDAQDIAQEVFIKAYSKLAQLKWPHRFQSWLYTIVSNECKMWRRSHSKEREQEVSWEDVPVETLNEIAVRNHSDEDIELTVKSAMETLPGDNQLALSLYYMSDLSVKEIASFMGVSPNTVKGKLHRARKQLGERLEKMIGKHLSKEKLKAGFVFKVVDSIRDMPIPSLPKPRPTRWVPIPISIGLAVLIGVIGYGVSSGRDVSQDMPVLKPVKTPFEVSLLPDLDEQEVLDIEVLGNELVALDSSDDTVLEAGINSNTGVVVRKVCAASSATDAYGAVSPDGSYITFAGWAAPNLTVRDITTGKDRYLTSEGNWDKGSWFASFSVWSPDSKQVAYMWWPNSDLRYQVRIIGLDGSEPRVLYSKENSPLAIPHTWSSDGRSILASLWPDDDKEDIVLISVADGSVRVLKSFERPESIKVSLSPDGRYVVYDHRASGDIFLLAADGSGATPLVEHPAYDYGPIWAPDGKSIVFGSDRSGTPDAWLLRMADGRPAGDPILVKRNIGWMRPMGFTQSGSLYYGLETGGRDIYFATLDPATGELLSPPTKAIRRFEGFNYIPAWSPDGKYLAYISKRRAFPAQLGGTDVLVIRSIETGEEREINSEWPNHHSLKWSPDGRSILARHRWQDLRLIDVQTGNVTRILTRECVRGAAWSPDGKTIFYILHPRRARAGQSIVAHDLETGQERELVHRLRDANGRGLAVSPDGRQLAFIGTRTLKVMPAAGGEPRELLRLESEGFDWPAGLAWTPDGNYILFVKHKSSPDQTNELWRIPAEGGTPQKLGIDGLSHISLHPDGQRVAFTATSPGYGEEIWAIENFLPESTASR